VYQDVLALLRTKEKEKSFVVTSNVDGFFEQNMFDVSRVYRPQGDLAILQCLEPCDRKVSERLIDAWFKICALFLCAALRRVLLLCAALRCATLKNILCSVMCNSVLLCIRMRSGFLCRAMPCCCVAP
jgi:hypothetical protein